ncbi:MAG: RNA methyltransferase [Desulfovibrio sp.]|nr:RNA methyltransferase [Desulfovibrio sp.]
MLLQHLDVILVGTRFPENVGMAARACANMGCPSIRLVQPERWDRAKAMPLATAKGQAVLDGICLYGDIPSAVAQSALVIGTTARTGGWRQALLAPAQAAQDVAQALARGDRVSLVFGPEDRGLSNDDIRHCGRLVTIPTAAEASSLNVAQAVLLLLYECAGAVRSLGEKGRQAVAASGGGRSINAAEQERLMVSFRDMLLQLDCLHGDNPDYFLLPWQRLFSRAALRRHEYDALMGLCRQVRHKIGRT